MKRAFSARGPTTSQAQNRWQARAMAVSTLGQQGKGSIPAACAAFDPRTSTCLLSSGCRSNACGDTASLHQVTSSSHTCNAWGDDSRPSFVLFFAPSLSFLTLSLVSPCGIPYWIPYRGSPSENFVESNDNSLFPPCGIHFSVSSEPFGVEIFFKIRSSCKRLGMNRVFEGRKHRKFKKKIMCNAHRLGWSWGSDRKLCHSLRQASRSASRGFSGVPDVPPSEPAKSQRSQIHFLRNLQTQTCVHCHEKSS